jgi:hypothetical protein
MVALARPSTLHSSYHIKLTAFPLLGMTIRLQVAGTTPVVLLLTNLISRSIRRSMSKRFRWGEVCRERYVSSKNPREPCAVQKVLALRVELSIARESLAHSGVSGASNARFYQRRL